MSPRRDTPTDRRWRDPRGTRRASVEFGGKSAGRRPSERRRRTSMHGHESRGARLGRRLGALGRFGVKHRGSLLAAVGGLGLAATGALALIGFELGVLTVSGLISAAVVVAGGVVHHHQKTRTMHRSPNVTNPTWRQRSEFEHAMRTGRQPDPRGTGPVSVSSSDRARAHTRARPGEAQAS